MAASGGPSINNDADWPRAMRLRTLFLISALYGFAALDRTALSLVVDPIRKEFGLTDGQFGTIVGLGFSIPQILFAFPVARIVDRGSRRLVILVSSAVWSGATALAGAAASPAMFLICRIFVGAGESANSVYPSVTSDLFGKNERGMAAGVYYGAAAIIGLIGMAGGGWIAQRFGWRWMLVAAGAPGLLLMLVALATLKDPKRGGAETGERHDVRATFAETMRFLVKQPTYILFVAGNVVFGLGFGTLLAWYPALLTRVHGMSTAQAGLMSGIGTGVAGFVGFIGGGLLLDRLVRRDDRWRATLPALCMLGFAPSVFVGASARSGAVAVIGFTFAFLFQAAMLSGAVALVQTLLRPRMRGVGSALFNVCSGLAAIGVAPVWSGYLNDHLVATHGLQGVRDSFYAAIGASLLAGCLYWCARRTLVNDMSKVEHLAEA